MRVMRSQWESLKIQIMKEWKVEELNLNGLSRITLVKEIAHICFTNLSYLQMKKNQINSIQGIAHIQMPLIQQLILTENNISSVSSMRKANWFPLSILSIDLNLFSNPKTLIQGFFPNLAILSLYNDYCGKENNQATDSSFPAKLSTRSMIILCIRANKFCFTRSLESVFVKKWNMIAIS